MFETILQCYNNIYANLYYIIISFNKMPICICEYTNTYLYYFNDAFQINNFISFELISSYKYILNHTK